MRKACSRYWSEMVTSGSDAFTAERIFIITPVSGFLCTFTERLRSCSGSLFISSNLPFFPLILPYRSFLKGLTICEVSFWPSLSYFISYVTPCNNLATISYSPSWTTQSSSWEFPQLCPDLHWSVCHTFTELVRSHLPIKTQVLYHFHHWGCWLAGNTDAKQEKSVLLFLSKSWWRRHRNQNKAGYEGISPCDIVNCCSQLLNNLYYSVAGVLHVLCELRETWWPFLCWPEVASCIINKSLLCLWGLKQIQS